MLTNFQKNRDDFNRMDGKSQEAMHGALRDWMSTAQEQHAILWRLAHLVEVLTLRIFLGCRMQISSCVRFMAMWLS